MVKLEKKSILIFLVIVLFLLPFVSPLLNVYQTLTSTRIEPSQMAVDSDGNIILVGETMYQNFPMINSHDRDFGGEDDIFIVKFDPEGRILFSTFYGGSRYEEVESIAIDSQDSIIISGNVVSNNLEVTDNAFKKEKTGSDADNFLAKFSREGVLLYSSYIGGTWNEGKAHVTVNSNDEITLFAQSASDDIFSTFDPSIVKDKQMWDLYMMKLSADGSVLDADFITDNEEINNIRATFKPLDIAANLDDQLLVLYETDALFSEENGDNTTTITSFGERKVCLAKYSSSFDLIWEHSYVSLNRGSLNELAIDSNNYINVVGSTYFDGFFNGTEGTIESHIQIAQFNSSGHIVWEKRYGGTDHEQGLSLSVDHQDNIVVTGLSVSDDFPVLNPYQSNFAGDGPRNEDSDLNNDIVLMKLDSNGSIVYSSYYGSSDVERLHDSQVSTQGDIILTGLTFSSNFTIGGVSNELRDNRGMNFLVKITGDTLAWGFRF